MDSPRTEEIAEAPENAGPMSGRELLGASRQADETSGLARVVEDSAERLFETEPGRLDIDEEKTKSSLAELLVASVAASDTRPHGKLLIDDLSNTLDTSVSPGTLYPELHGLSDDGILTQHELVHTKVYGIDDRAAARERLLRGARTHLLLAQVLYSAVDSLEDRSRR